MCQKWVGQQPSTYPIFIPQRKNQPCCKGSLIQIASRKISGTSSCCTFWTNYGDLGSLIIAFGMLIFRKLDIKSEIDEFLSRKPKLCKCVFGNMLTKTALMGPHKLNIAPIHHRLLLGRMEGEFPQADYVLHADSQGDMYVSLCRGKLLKQPTARDLHLSQRDLWVHCWVGSEVTLELIKTLKGRRERRCEGNYSGRGSQWPGSASAPLVWSLEAPSKLFVLFLHPNFPSNKKKL